MKKEVNEKVESKAVKAPSKANRIVSIVLVVLVSILALSIILCTFIPKNYNFGLQDPDRIVLHTSSTTDVDNGLLFEKDSEEYNKIMDLYNNGFKSSILGAMFQGKLASEMEVKEGYKSTNLSSDYYLEFQYNDSTKIKVNGKDYSASIVSDTNYISVVISINDSSSLDETTAYFKYKATGEYDYSYVRISSYSAQAKLYDYLKNID